MLEDNSISPIKQLQDPKLYIQQIIENKNQKLKSLTQLIFNKALLGIIMWDPLQNKIIVINEQIKKLFDSLNNNQLLVILQQQKIVNLNLIKIQLKNQGVYCQDETDQEIKILGDVVKYIINTEQSDIQNDRIEIYLQFNIIIHGVETESKFLYSYLLKDGEICEQLLILIIDVEIFSNNNPNPYIQIQQQHENLPMPKKEKKYQSIMMLLCEKIVQIKDSYSQHIQSPTQENHQFLKYCLTNCIFFLKISTKKILLYPEQFSFYELINKCSLELQLQYPQKITEVSINIDKNSSSIVQDKKATKLILKNILSNAFIYSNEQQLQIQINVQKQGEIYKIQIINEGTDFQDCQEIINNIRNDFLKNLKGLGLYVAHKLVIELNKKNDDDVEVYPQNLLQIEVVNDTTIISFSLFDSLGGTLHQFRGESIFNDKVKSCNFSDNQKSNQSPFSGKKSHPKSKFKDYSSQGKKSLPAQSLGDFIKNE